MSDTRRRCPLCTFRSDEQTVYRHLQTAHLKSELSSKLLELSHTEADWLGEQFVQSETTD
ncbi:hypothetical protein ACFQL1_23020 [Halomicroarcula sp. GCM10025709]|uniref:hypothetical protein n=1 Tax=Haloarcula TaxID=2237 RepID=UPI0024C2F753|nr:hypothetical protein [Halomicroarcula sp. YJ-61-S]